MFARRILTLKTKYLKKFNLKQYIVCFWAELRWRVQKYFFVKNGQILWFCRFELQLSDSTQISSLMHPLVLFIISMMECGFQGGGGVRPCHFARTLCLLYSHAFHLRDYTVYSCRSNVFWRQTNWNQYLPFLLGTSTSLVRLLNST